MKNKSLKHKVSHFFRKKTLLLRGLPDFIIVGAMKSGTTSLYNYVIQHPQILKCFQKETHFFIHGFKRGFNYYRLYFPTNIFKKISGIFLRKKIIAGEATPSYLFHPLASARIKKYLPQVKIIVLLRNPIDRAYSHYQHMRDSGMENLSFEETLAAEDMRSAGLKEKMESGEIKYSQDYMMRSYKARGRYGEQLKVYYDLFPKEQILVLKSEDMFSDLDDFLNQVFDFLKVDRCKIKNKKNFYKREYEPMKPETREALKKYFETYNQDLYKLLGRDFGWD